MFLSNAHFYFESLLRINNIIKHIFFFKFYNTNIFTWKRITVNGKHCEILSLISTTCNRARSYDYNKIWNLETSLNIVNRCTIFPLYVINTEKLLYCIIWVGIQVEIQNINFKFFFAFWTSSYLISQNLWYIGLSKFFRKTILSLTQYFIL